jgi:glycosyltransferase involved in cell wall biosynthesis
MVYLSCSLTVRKSPRSKPLHIGIDARLAYRRGVGTYAANLILALSKIDRKNRYSIFNAPHALRSQISSSRFNWVTVPFSNAAYYEQVLLPRAAREQGVGLLHYTDNSATAIDPIPFVVTLHDTMHTRPLAQVRPKATFRNRLVDGYKKWSIARSAPRAKAVLTVSEFSKSQILAHMGIDGTKVFVTPEGVDRRLFQKASRKPSKLFKILAHGAADERKNIPNILKAVKILADQGKKFQVIILGMDEAELKCTNYMDQVVSLRIGSLLEWAGNVPFEMLSHVYAEADMFLYPSRLEGFGLPVLEACSCGVPVIASNTTSLLEVAGDAALLVDPESPQAIAKAMKQMMEKPVLRRRYIQRGLKRAKLFTWEKTARLTLNVYERVGQPL